jgi:hypothetical protein
MKVTFHLSSKNVCNVVTGICVIVLAYIPLAVPPDHWLWMRWTIAVIACGIAAIFALGYQALAQSKEDADREIREQMRDNALAGVQKSLSSGPTLAPPALSNALTRGLPHPPGTFDSVDFFRTAFYSALQDVSANSFRAEAERVRPSDKESFYLDVLTVGAMQLIYNDLWYPLYRSQLRALMALNTERGVLPIDEFRKPYDEAEKEFADKYAQLKITFESWMEYMENNQLLKVHPSKMVEITLKGKDFLKYLLHYGRSESAKRL